MSLMRRGKSDDSRKILREKVFLKAPKTGEK